MYCPAAIDDVGAHHQLRPDEGRPQLLLGARQQVFQRLVLVDALRDAERMARLGAQVLDHYRQLLGAHGYFFLGEAFLSPCVGAAVNGHRPRRLVVLDHSGSGAGLVMSPTVSARLSAGGRPRRHRGGAFADVPSLPVTSIWCVSGLNQTTPSASLAPGASISAGRVAAAPGRCGDVRRRRSRPAAVRSSRGCCSTCDERHDLGHRSVAVDEAQDDSISGHDTGLKLGPGA